MISQSWSKEPILTDFLTLQSKIWLVKLVKAMQKFTTGGECRQRLQTFKKSVKKQKKLPRE